MCVYDGGDSSLQRRCIDLYTKKYRGKMYYDRNNVVYTEDQTAGCFIVITVKTVRVTIERW